jgi:hypothetical protein
LRLGLIVTAMSLFTACGGDEGIRVSGPIASLTASEACLAAGDPGTDPGDETCYRIETSSEIAPGLRPGDLVTLRASDGAVVELTKIGAPE